MGEIISHPQGGVRGQEKDVVLVTGSSGLIGYNLIKRLAGRYRVVGLDRLGPPYPPLEAECVNFDITDRDAIDASLERVRYGYGDRIASVVHLAAYYNFASKESEMYDEITIKGTEKFLAELQDFQVEQFIFASSDLIYKPSEPGKKIDEDSSVEANWGYPRSKIVTEELIRKERGKIPALFLRIAGAYTEMGDSIPITQQIRRIYEKVLTSHLYSGDVNHGNVFVHLEDILRAFELCIDKRTTLPNELALNIGEPETPTYQELQDKIGKLLHGEEWKTIEVPKTLAKAGAWTMDLFGDPFIKPWMIDRADDHYELDVSRAEKYLGWKPQHKIMDVLPEIIENLRKDPEKWYHHNNIKE